MGKKVTTLGTAPSLYGVRYVGRTHMLLLGVFASAKQVDDASGGDHSKGSEFFRFSVC